MKVRYIIYFVAFLLIVSACSGTKPDENKIDPFTFINQYEKPFGLEDLSGTVWIANFFFTNCETVCPPMMLELALLQEEIAKSDLDVIFVSFSVDPKIDTPEVLQEYLQQFTNNKDNWYLLTGYSQDEIEKFSREQFQTIVQKPDSSSQVIHGTNFYLIDDQGYILNEYNYIDESHVDEIIQEVEDVYQ